MGTDGATTRSTTPDVTLFDTAKIFLNGLFGREEEPKSDLAALHKRRAIENYFKKEGDLRSVEVETEFWTGLFAKVGLGGSY